MTLRMNDADQSTSNRPASAAARSGSLRGRVARLGVGTTVVALALALFSGRSEASLSPNGLKIHNGMKVHNGMSGHNGMKVQNGISGHNGMKVQNGMSGHNGMKIHNGLAPARIFLDNGIDPRAPLSAATK